MENNKDNEFDLYVRSIMENATEEVPPRVWEKCEAALGAPAVKPAPARLRWPWFLVPAVAAAVAAIVYVGVPRQGGSPALVAEVGPAEIIVDEAVPAVVPQDEVVPSALPSKAAPVVSRPAPKASAPVVSECASKHGLKKMSTSGFTESAFVIGGKCKIIWVSAGIGYRFRR